MNEKIKVKYHFRLGSDEVKRGIVPNQVACSDFHNGINSNYLFTLPIRDPFFTWSNGILGHSRIIMKLDRVLVNFSCIDQWGNSRYSVLPTNCSNHNPFCFFFLMSIFLESLFVSDVLKCGSNIIGVKI